MTQLMSAIFLVAAVTSTTFMFGCRGALGRITRQSAKEARHPLHGLEASFARKRIVLLDQRAGTAHLASVDGIEVWVLRSAGGFVAKTIHFGPPPGAGRPEAMRTRDPAVQLEATEDGEIVLSRQLPRRASAETLIAHIVALVSEARHFRTIAGGRGYWQMCLEPRYPSVHAPSVGDVVVLNRQRAVEGERGWTPAMEALVGQRAEIVETGHVDEQGCPVTRVDSDGGLAAWRIRDLTAISRHVSSAADPPEQSTDSAVVVYGGSWCKPCMELERWLNVRGCPHQHFDVKEEDVQERLLRILGSAGYREGTWLSLPVVVVGEVVVMGASPALVHPLLPLPSPTSTSGS